MSELKICIDKTLPLSKLPEAHEVALRERVGNAPDSSALADVQRVLEMVGGSLPALPRLRPGPEIGAAVLLSSKRWRAGRMIKVGWFRGPYNESDELRTRIRYHAGALERYMNLNFRFIGFNPEDADLRISDERDGSWSYVGTDNLLIPRDESTMNFGWLTPDSSEDEIRRVVKHEFLHAAGLGHEHQNPKDGVPWNEEAVYRYYMGPPNNWSREDVYYQVIRRYSESMVVATERDPASIMHYAIPASLLTDPSKAVGWNDDLSAGDKRFLRSIYPYPAEQEAA